MNSERRRVAVTGLGAVTPVGSTIDRMWRSLVAGRSGVDYIRFSSSSVVDKPSAGVAVRLTLENSSETIQTARIVLGCVGATPVRARKAEALLNGNNLVPKLAEEAGSVASQECSPTSDLRGSEQYKRAIVRTLVKRAAVKAYERAK